MTNQHPALDRHPLVRILHSVNRLFARAYHRLDVLTPCPVPRTGAGIVVCNHSAGLDPLLIQAACPRVISWMMAKEYFELPILKPMCERLGFIPVSRGGRDSSSLKASLRALANGRMLGIFPEGRIEPDEDLLPFQPGVGVMAVRAGVPIYPAYLGGIQRDVSIARSLLEPQQAVIAFDKPISPGEDAAQLTAKMRRTIETLKKHCFAARVPRIASDAAN